MNEICPVQGVGGEISIRTALIQAGMWNIARLAEDSGVAPKDVMAVLFNQIVTSQVVYRLMCFLNNLKGAGRWMMK